MRQIENYLLSFVVTPIFLQRSFVQGRFAFTKFCPRSTCEGLLRALYYRYWNRCTPDCWNARHNRATKHRGRQIVVVRGFVRDLDLPSVRSSVLAKHRPSGVATMRTPLQIEGVVCRIPIPSLALRDIPYLQK